jgi:CHAD domain-containing protein
MASTVSIASVSHHDHTGLAYWMRHVPKECDRARRDLDPEAVHDLRVALRRCRSMADELHELDPDPVWRKMRKAGRKLFRRLGELRDAQVMIEWVKKLAPEDDPIRQRMLEILGEREKTSKADAERALARFDRKRWRRWSRELPERARRVPREGLVFQHLALERWNEAYELDRRARRNRSRAAWHRLRIGLKHFRYTVENFLPRRYAEWGEDLKHLQDLLGEAQDLNVLWATLRRTLSSADADTQARWKARIDDERTSRVNEYREKMTGKTSLWPVWRAGLPSGKRLEAGAIARLSVWASFQDADFAHAHKVAELALQLFDGFRAAGINDFFRETRARRILQAAALLHEVGRADGDRGHHKASYRRIRSLSPPPDWTKDDMKWVALVARYHRGAEPRDNHEGFGALAPAEKQGVSWLAGLLRLADSLVADRGSRVTRLLVQKTPEAVVVEARGYIPDSAVAGEVAEKKHLLELLCARPVVVRAQELEVEASDTPQLIAS